MFTGYPVEHHESGTRRRNNPPGPQRPRCVISKEPRPGQTDRRRGINISGVDFWHAVEFSRNGRFLRTHPSGLSSGRFPSVFPTLSDHFTIRFPRCFPAFRPSGVVDSIRSLSSLRGLTPSQPGLPLRLLGRSDFPNPSGSLRRFPIEWISSGSASTHAEEIEFGHAESHRGDLAEWFDCRCRGGSCCRRTVTASWQLGEPYGSGAGLSSVPRATRRQTSACVNRGR
ncbi:hypothetical protein MBT84_22830 [Streptomyces sp. MBT84]|nr:hypothetical protein [Streptomyces sp. MBT84]